MNCPICNNKMSQGIYICTANDNRVLDSSDNLVFIHKANNIESGSEEIGSYNDVYYCSTDNYFEPYEKQITTEKKAQNDAQKAANRDNAKTSFFNIVSSFIGGKSQGGALGKGQPSIVGERGPELFIPNSSGQITQNARGMSGRSAVVNFNINTIDSRGFDEALQQNRGTITAIINNALTEKGRGELI